MTSLNVSLLNQSTNSLQPHWLYGLALTRRKFVWEFSYAINKKITLKVIRCSKLTIRELGEQHERVNDTRTISISVVLFFLLLTLNFELYAERSRSRES